MQKWRTSAVIGCVLMVLRSSSALAGSLLDLGKPIDEEYRHQFQKCDTSNTFGRVTFPILNAAGHTVWYGCKSDPSRFDHLAAVVAAGGAPSAVILTSKLGHDEDGSKAACNHHGGPTDQCTTSLMLDADEGHPCVVKNTAGKRCIPVDPDLVPYVVIPGSAPRGIEARQFSKLTRLEVGDYGVVIVGDRTVPVIIADEGPSYKIGEGSTALLRGLSPSGSATTRGSGVVFVMFPGTREAPGSLSAGALASHVKDKAQALFSALPKQ